MGDNKPIDMKVGYNIITEEGIKANKFIELPVKMSFIEFFRKLKRKKLDQDVQVSGLDYLLFSSEKPKDLAKNLRSLLIDYINYLNNDYISVQIVCRKLEKWDKVIAFIEDKKLYLEDIFGTLEEIDNDYFFKIFNILT